MIRKLLLLGTPLVIIAGLGAYMWSRPPKTYLASPPPAASRPSTTATTPVTSPAGVVPEETTPPAPEASTAEGAINGGRAIMCSMFAVDPGAFLTGTAYTDGRGSALQTIQMGKFLWGTLIRPSDTHVRADAAGVDSAKVGTIMPTRPEYARDMQFTSGEAFWKASVSAMSASHGTWM